MTAGRPALAWYGDSAYGTGDLRAAIAAAGHQAVIKPRPLLPAVAGGFTADDFTVDEAAGTVTCPAGITRQVTARNAVIFGAACRDCPLRERCTTAKDGRTLHLHEHDGLLRAARADWAAGPGLRQDYMAHRPNVERAIAQVATWRGRRLKLRYRGETSEPRLAQAPHRRAEPAQPARPRPGPPRRHLGRWPPDQPSRHDGQRPRKDPPARPPRPASQAADRTSGPDTAERDDRRRVINAHQKRPNSAGS